MRVYFARFFDARAIDRFDLSDEQRDDVGTRDVNKELVDRDAATAFQDIDADDVALGGGDARCNGTKGTRSIGKEDTNHKMMSHGGIVEG